MKSNPKVCYSIREWLLLGLFACGGLALLVRAADLQMRQSPDLRERGEAHYLHTTPVAAHRGMILDRDGEPLAISTPVKTIWANPQAMPLDALDEHAFAPMAKALGAHPEALRAQLSAAHTRSFIYLRRQLTPSRADEVLAYDVPGVHGLREYRRYYPDGEVFGQLLGFTDIDDRGQEGIELTYDRALSGTPGRKRVLRDRQGRILAEVAELAAPQPGRQLQLSVDKQIQYVAFRALSEAVTAHNAKAGSAVLLAVPSFEILSIVNQPAANPNDRGQRVGGGLRNRAITDLYEPGSTIKPFTIAAALENEAYGVDTLIETEPGTMRVGRYTIRDLRDYGTLDIAGVLRKSSNVGATKIALSLPPEQLWSMFHRIGVGQQTGARFPGEPFGVLRGPDRWRTIDQATLAYGYGMSMSVLQLARAYAVLASDGLRRPVSILRRPQLLPAEQVLDPALARLVRGMLEAVVSDDGTAPLARVAGYSIAGKTGTVHKAVANGYARDRYVSLFAGMAPASEPRLVLAVLIDEPRGSVHYGGLVAAPVFAEVMAQALRLLNIPPDRPDELLFPEPPPVQLADRNTSDGGQGRPDRTPAAVGLVPTRAQGARPAPAQPPRRDRERPDT